MADILASLDRLQDWKNVLDIALVTIIFYGLLRLFRGTQAVQLVRGILVISLAIAVVSQNSGLTAFNWLLEKSSNVLLVAIPIIFQPEIRRALERVGRSAPLFLRRMDSASSQRLVNEVVKAVEDLSKRRHGALIVFESTTGLAEYINSGTVLEAELTSELLLTIFWPNTALHDGAVIVRGDKITAAGCVLPLTQREIGDSQMGTRHRAAIGISEQTDSLTIVVSEETGIISVARSGRIPKLDSNRLRTVLSDFYKP